MNEHWDDDGRRWWPGHHEAGVNCDIIAFASSFISCFISGFNSDLQYIDNKDGRWWSLTWRRP